jgi:hypothetical protein
MTDLYRTMKKGALELVQPLDMSDDPCRELMAETATIPVIPSHTVANSHFTRKKDPQILFSGLAREYAGLRQDGLCRSRMQLTKEPEIAASQAQ